MIEETTYLGYMIYVHNHDLTAEAPDGETFTSRTMSSIRRWIRRHRKENK